MTGALSQFPMGRSASKLQAQGRDRDTILAHLEPAEARLLLAIGGRGSANPKTGLPEFGLGPGGAGASGGVDHDGGAADGGMGDGGQGGMGRGAGDHGVGDGGTGTYDGGVAGGFAFDFSDPAVREAAFGKPQVGTQGFANAVNQSFGLAAQNPVADGVVGALSTGVLGTVGGPLAALGLAASQLASNTNVTGPLGRVAESLGYEGKPHTGVSMAGRTPGGLGTEAAGRAAQPAPGGALDAIVEQTQPEPPKPAAPSTFYYVNPWRGGQPVSYTPGQHWE